MNALLVQKIKEIDEGEWKLKFKNHELAVKDLVEPVEGVIDWAKDYVGTALESSSYGSITWAGGCVLLPVSAAFTASHPVLPYLGYLVLNLSKQEATRVEAPDEIAIILSRCVMKEALYHRRYESSDHGESKRELAFSRVMVDMAKWNDWVNMLDKIKKQENTFKSIEEQWRDMKYDEECKLHNDRHEQRMRGLSEIEDEVSCVLSVIMQAQSDNELEKLLKCLSSVDPSKKLQFCSRKPCIVERCLAGRA